MNQFERIAHLKRRFGEPPAPTIGIGDDCAVLPESPCPLAAKVDAVVEGVHFRRDWLALDLAAERAVESTLSDLAAAGATIESRPSAATGILCALTLPVTAPDADFEALIGGVARAASRAKAPVVGGSLVAADVLTVTITALGRLDGRPMQRSGARPGDMITLVGDVGVAALGLKALSRGREQEPRFAPFVSCWRSLRAKLREGRRIAGVASAAIDISDGLAADLGHMADASNCGIVVDCAAIPLRPGQEDAANALGLNALDLTLRGGDDFALAFAFRADCSRSVARSGRDR